MFQFEFVAWRGHQSACLTVEVPNLTVKVGLYLCELLFHLRGLHMAFTNNFVLITYRGLQAFAVEYEPVLLYCQISATPPQFLLVHSLPRFRSSPSSRSLHSPACRQSSMVVVMLLVAMTMNCVPMHRFHQWLGLENWYLAITRYQLITC